MSQLINATQCEALILFVPGLKETPVEIAEYEKHVNINTRRFLRKKGLVEVGMHKVHITNKGFNAIHGYLHRIKSID